MWRRPADVSLRERLVELPVRLDHGVDAEALLRTSTGEPTEVLFQHPLDRRRQFTGVLARHFARHDFTGAPDICADCRRPAQRCLDE